MLTAQQQTSLATAAQASVASEKATGLPAELTLAQAIFESAWGAAAPGNNCFGIKEYPGCSGRQLLTTYEWLTDKEVQAFLTVQGRVAIVNSTMVLDGRHLYTCKDWFATFPSLKECFTFHGRLITTGKPYAAAWAQYQKDRQLNPFILAVAKIYATAPNYGQQILDMGASPWFIKALNQV